MVDISVVVASHRPDYVTALVEAMGAAVWGEMACEVIVVADYPVEEFARHYPSVRWLHHPDRGIAVKRNKGAYAAHGRYLAFIDDDCVPGRGWLVAAARFLESNLDIAGVEGRTTIERSRRAEPYLREFKRLERRGYRTNNICYRAEVFREVGMFDERFTVQREDIDLAFTIIESGRTIGYNDTMVVTHRLRRHEKWDLLKNCVNRRFDPLLYRKHHTLYRQYIGTPFPPSFGVVMLLHGVTVALALAGEWWWVAAAFDAVVAGALMLRRTGIPSSFASAVREYISYVVAPLVVLGALVYGSIVHRTVVLW
jgi:GT2 family glycosyltransferase